MSVSKMKKLTLVTMKHDTRRITEKLMWLGCVEVEKNPRDTEKSRSLSDALRGRAVDELKTLQTASSVLLGYTSARRGFFSPPPTVSKNDFRSGRTGNREYTDVLERARLVIERKKALDALEAEKHALEDVMRSLSPFLSYDAPLSITETKKTEIIFGSLPSEAFKELNEASLKECTAFSLKAVSEDEGVIYASVVYLKESEENTARELSRRGFTRISLPNEKDTPLLCLSRLKAKKEALLFEAESIIKELKNEASLLDSLSVATDMAETAEQLAVTEQKLYGTERTSVLSGWIPAERAPKLEKALKNEPVFFSLDEPEEGDDVPVHLVNGRTAGYFESVVNMYSPPAYGSFDPTRIMAFFFFIIFGLMLADAVYGIIITLGSLFLIKKTNASDGVKKICGLFTACGISSLIFGILFGSYLGDLPAQFMKEFFGVEVKAWSALDIMSEPIVFLVLSLALGGVHILTGMGIRFYVLWTDGEVFSAIFDEGSWFVIFGGVGLYFLNPAVGIITVGVGVAMLLLTQGRREKNLFMKAIKGVGSLYRLVGFTSDLLSYSRIMALGLSSAVVASVFNILATMGGRTFFGVILMIIIIPLGHLLNLAINLLGTFVHTSRLQYVEFFGRFFEDGGRAFRPLTPKISRCAISDASETE